MELEDINLEEIKPFLDSLTVETKYFTASAKRIIDSAVFLKGARVDNKLAGIGGLTKSYGCFLSSFHVFKSGFQRRGLDDEITRSIVRFAKKKRCSFFLAQVRRENITSVFMTQKQGYRISYDDGDMYWMFFPLNKVGEIIGKYVLPLVFMIYLSPVGKPLRLLHPLPPRNGRET